MEVDPRVKISSIMEDNRPVYTLGVAAQLADMPAHSIRQYVDKGLLIPYKLKSNRHLFSRNDLKRLKNIHSLIHDRGLNFAGIRAVISAVPCWAMRKCSDEERETCNAYSDCSIPCWEASEKGRMCKNENCRTCDVYTTLSHRQDLKSILKEIM